jgi:hypothetical protein
VTFPIPIGMVGDEVEGTTAILFRHALLVIAVIILIFQLITRGRNA